MSRGTHVTMDYGGVFIYVIIAVETVFQGIQGKVRNINMCRRNIMIRKDIVLYHNVDNLDLQMDDVTCQCDLYTPPYKGCVNMKALSVDTLALLQNCEIPKGHSFNINNTSCIIQYRVNEVYNNCTHNATVMIVADKVLHEPVKEWLYISASDGSGVYVNCKWTGTLSTATYDMETTEMTSSPTYSTEMTEITTDRDFTNSTCPNCTTPSVRHRREIKPSEVADQIEILIATASGFVVAFLIITFICVCISSTKRKGKLEVTQTKQKQTVAQLLVTTEVPAPSSVYDSVFVDTCSAELKRDGSGSYSEPVSNDTEDENTNKYVHIVRRSSNDCYDNIAFET